MFNPRCTPVGHTFKTRCAALRRLVRPREVHSHAVAAIDHARRCHRTLTEGVACYLRRLGIGYAEDHPSDRWCTPAQTLHRGKGDCDDHSILGAALLRSVGVYADVALGWMHKPDGTRGYHAWIVGNDPQFGMFSMEPQSGDVWWGTAPPRYDAEAQGGPDGCWRVDRFMNVLA